MKLEKNNNSQKNILFNYFNNKNSNSVPLLGSPSGRKKYIDWGLNDRMGDRLFELYNQSGFHRAIIDSRVNMIVGDGLVQDIDDETKKSKRTEDFIKFPNNYDSMDSLLKKISYDYEIFGLAYIEIIYNEKRSEIVELNHVDASKIRWGKKSLNKITHFYYSDNWKKINSNKPVALPIFNPRLKEDYPRQIMPIVRYTPSIDYYTLPSYYSVIKWINIDYEISNFHENNIKNGFAPTVYFGFPMGTPTEGEREEVVKKLEKKYGGTDNSGGVITAFYEPGSDNKVDVQILDITDADKQYEWLKKATQQEILIGHRVTNENLVGISTPGKLGSSSELLQSHELYYNDVIKHEQNDILTQLNKILTYNGMENVKVLNSKPLSQEFSENILSKILDINELRDIIGYDAVEEEISEITNTATFNEIDECYDVDNKILDSGDKILMNGKDFTLSQEIIDRSTGLNSDSNDKDLYAWSLGTGGLSQKNCPSCLGYAGKIRSLRNWKRNAIPGTPQSTSLNIKYKHGDYGTFCESHCTCKLIKINK